VTAAAEPHLDDFALAAELVCEAGALAARMLAEGLQTKRKTSASDVVSAADHAAEQLIVRRLTAARPADGLIGEEGAARSSASATGRTWYIDPVDGTYNFLSKLPFWCSALGLVDEDGPVLGAVYHPTADELWLGGRGRPTTCNGLPVPELEAIPLRELSLASYLHPDTLSDAEALAPTLAAISGAATVRMLGSGSIELASVAGGRIGIWVQRDTLDWDWLPGVALVRAAGGHTEVIEHRGHRWHIAGNALAVSEIVEALTR
jgi:fructose-1,6-bisphosphatase/inositol monophosphatase family enzyme